MDISGSGQQWMDFHSGVFETSRGALGEVILKEHDSSPSRLIVADLSFYSFDVNGFMDVLDGQLSELYDPTLSVEVSPPPSEETGSEEPPPSEETGSEEPPFINPFNMTTVPNVVGLEAPDAYVVIVSSGLTHTQTGAGIFIVNQTPSPNTPVELGSNVVLQRGDIQPNDDSGNSEPTGSEPTGSEEPPVINPFDDSGNDETYAIPSDIIDMPISYVENALNTIGIQYEWVGTGNYCIQANPDQGSVIGVDEVVTLTKGNIQF